MKDILLTIENTFGEVTLQVVVAFVALYFAFTGASKLIDILRSFKLRQHFFEERKHQLELEKK